MRYKVENLNDLDDTKSFLNGYLESCSYHLLKYNMYLIIVLLISIVTWGLYAEKEVCVNAFGNIDVSDNICNLYIENTSIGKIKEDDKIQIEVVSLSRNEFGVIHSTIESISDDVVDDKKSGKKYYVITCKLSQDRLISKKGEYVKLKNGMEVNASIIIDKMSYLEYILKK